MECIWLVDVMMSPEMPVGWMRRSTSEGTEFYWSAILGCAQWEHPMISTLTGVVSELQSRRSSAETHRAAP